MENSSESQVTQALQLIARNLEMKEYIQQSPEWYPLLFSVAKRFVTGETREEGLFAGHQLTQKGYRVSLEFIGENTKCEEECIRAKEEFVELIKQCGNQGIDSRISFDLSHIGLSVDPELAYLNLREIANEAKLRGLSLMISMEESAKTDSILSVYKQVVMEYTNVGITLQAHLHRTVDDVKELLQYPGAIRLVKGAFQEPSGICISRSEKLDQRFLELVDICISNNHPLSIASHDDKIYQQVIERGYFQSPHVEAEMLYGIRPELCKHLHKEGLPVRIYLTYGTEWYLYLCHRLAEYPPNIYDAITDLIKGEKNYFQHY